MSIEGCTDLAKGEPLREPEINESAKNKALSSNILRKIGQKHGCSTYGTRANEN